MTETPAYYHGRVFAEDLFPELQEARTLNEVVSFIGLFEESAYALLQLTGMDEKKLIRYDYQTANIDEDILIATSYYLARLLLADINHRQLLPT